jgi:outer membrane protein OmpA-like peptidoglycan-associated protein
MYQKNTVSNPDGYMKMPMIFPHVDFMVNMSNWIGGERDDRVYYAVLFAGFGYHATGFTKKFHEDWGAVKANSSFAFAAGLLNKFRVARGLDIELELKSWVLSSQTSLHPQIVRYATDRISLGYSATLGLAFRFNKRGWEQASPYTPEDIAAYRQAVAERDALIAAVEAENEDLTDDLAAAEAARKQAEADAAAAKKAAELAKWGPNSEHGDDIYLTGKNITFFNIGSTDLTTKEMTRLDLISTQIKDAPASKVYLIEGYADASTGSKAINTRLAEARAKKVYDYLISKGVKAENLTYTGYGDTEKLFEADDQNRAAIIH